MRRGCKQSELKAEAVRVLGITAYDLLNKVHEKIVELEGSPPSDFPHWSFNAVRSVESAMHQISDVIAHVVEKHGSDE